MRLLQLHDNGNVRFIERVGNNVPPYAILSHTWGPDNDEVVFKDLIDGQGQEKNGYRKLTFCGEQAACDGLEYFWVDTCCIDKSSSAELTEAINSMFLWYRKAVKCYVYLSDVSTSGAVGNSVTFSDSRWFTRGWTLQELLAPAYVEFFSVEGDSLGTKSSRLQELATITGISVAALQRRDLAQFTVEERMNWTKTRVTTREEDMAYSLLGIFDVHMPLIYGEGREKSFGRLQRAIQEEREAIGKQSGDVQQHFVALQSQITQISNQLSDQRPNHIHGNIDMMEKSFELMESIENLQAIVSQEGTVHDEEAEPLINDLECILSSVERSDHSFTLSSKRKLEEIDAGQDISSREIKRLRGLISLANSISLNVGAPRSEQDKTGRIVQKRKVKELITKRYEITIGLNERMFLAMHDSQAERTVSPDTTESITRIKVHKRSKAPTVLMAYLCYIEDQAGMQFLNPVISIGKIIPDNSELFTIVQDGIVDQLKDLLDRRQCTLRDRDTFGTPLLHYAMDNPEICKFLVENGADVDEVACLLWNRAYQGPPLIEYSVDYEDTYEDDWNGDKRRLDMFECRRLLLQDGADPTLPGINDTINSFRDCLLNGFDDSLKVILDFSPLFIHLEETDQHGNTALLQLLGHIGFGCHDTMRVKLLLDRGANIRARNSLGNNCLQIALNSACAPGVSRVPDMDEMEAVILLIQRGADVFNTDNSNRSTFDDAYVCDHGSSGSFLGGYRGDLWDAALSRCDYSDYMRKPEDRVRHYTKYYTQEDFRLLWKGREHLCPYFPEDSGSLCPGVGPAGWVSEVFDSSE
jgi:hypothetical protein